MGAGSGKSQAADGKNSMSIIDIRSVLVATVHTATKFDLVDVHLLQIWSEIEKGDQKDPLFKYNSATDVKLESKF